MRASVRNFTSAWRLCVVCCLLAAAQAARSNPSEDTLQLSEDTKASIINEYLRENNCTCSSRHPQPPADPPPTPDALNSPPTTSRQPPLARPTSSPPATSTKKPPAPILFGGASPSEPPATKCRCVQVLDPVCASTDKPSYQVQTYMNSCFSSCAGAFILFESECGAFATSPGSVSSSPPAYGSPPSPVDDAYIADEGSASPPVPPFTPSNPPGKVDPEGCVCIEIYAPVCAQPKNESSNPITFSNSCKASCAKADILYEGPCCTCTTEVDPVCAELPGGDQVTKTFTNQGCAECAGGTVKYKGRCL